MDLAKVDVVVASFDSDSKPSGAHLPYHSGCLLRLRRPP